MAINLGEEKVSSVLRVEGGTGGTTNYVDLDNKPSINGVELVGDKTSSDLGLETQQIDAYTKDETNAAIASAITGKADINYVDNQLNLKADKVNTYTKTEVDNAINSASTNLNNKLNNKADKTSVYTKEELPNVIATNTVNKADTSYVNGQLALKADKENTYTKEEVDQIFDNPTITGDTLPIGSLVLYNGLTIPQNWLLCDGREVSRETYSELFAAIGTIWGSGDGTTSFNLPNYLDKFPLGAGGNTDLAETGGEKEVTLTVDTMPNHKHNILRADGGVANQLAWGSNEWDTGMLSTSGVNKGSTQTITATGGGRPHNNMPPYVGSYYIIKAKQSAGVIATVVDTLDSTSTTDALSAKQGKKLNDKFKPVVLYDNSEGTINNFTLNDNVSNYDYIDIETIQSGYTESCKVSRLYEPNNKYIAINYQNFEDSQNIDRLQNFGIRLLFNQKNVTIDKLYGYVVGSTSYGTVSNSVKITKILGFKY